MTDIVRLAFVGDLMLGRGVSRNLRGHAPEWFWGDVLPSLCDADGVVANLEAPITTNRSRWRQSWKMFHFRANPSAIDILTCGNVRCVCLANNHILDFDQRGLNDTLRALDAAGIRHAGAGRNLSEAAAPTMFELGELKIGLIAATDNMRDFAARRDRPGTNFMEFAKEPGTLDWIERSVVEMRQRGANVVVLSLHWGPNMRTAPSAQFQCFAHAAIERGIDVVHGHSAHVVQAVERYGHGIIMYDTGNFIDDYWKFPFRETTSSFVFLLDIEDGRPARLRLIPVHLHSVPLSLATGKSAVALKKRMAALCSDFGTPIRDGHGGLEIPITQHEGQGALSI